MKARSIVIITFLIIFGSLFSDVINYDKVIRNLKGVKSYEKENYENSGEDFKRNAIKYPKDSRLHFNQANAQVKNGMLEEAEQNYKLALNNEKFKDKSKALQNLGNVKFLQKDYKNAIKNYRDALVEDPQNLDARYNYELAAKMLQRQQEQKQKQEQNKDEEKEKQEEEQQQDKQENKNDEQEEKQQKQEEQKQDEKQKSQEQKMKEQKKEDAEKMLKALLQKEKEEMKKEKEKMNVDRAKSGKYW
ncbi:MAG: hypothetical protein HOB92_07985 [Candidatus Cloacimonetes bacterium]|jgi:Ca-activated chloride channel homolog|nr:hypothetical protein [Candidatus Cloacimonadota bacterium]MBT4576393.1 hypothetical protein [Candidatus Cloacimonadota bacterium]